MISLKNWVTFISIFSASAGIAAVALGQEDYSVKPQLFEAEDGAPSDAGLAFASSDSTSPDCDGCGSMGCCPRCCCPTWTATADFIVLDRTTGKPQTIVPGRLPGDDVLNSSDFAFGFWSGPRVSLIRSGCRGYDLELLYFGIDGWSSTRIVPVSETLYDSPLQFDWSSKLYNAEFNVRWNPLCRLTMLAGFRWAQLRENFTGGFLYDSTFDPTYNIKTENNLYGFQIGADATLYQVGCFSVEGLMKAGVYGNHAEQTTSYYSQEQTVLFASSTDRAAFIGEIGLQGRYQVTDCLTLRAGYMAMWLDGVALAPAQLQDVLSVDTRDTVFYHGATAGLEYRF
jgi:hypothetical protein